MANTGTLTTIPPDNTDRFNRPVVMWQCTWVADGSGNVTQQIGNSTVRPNGRIFAVGHVQVVSFGASAKLILKDQNGFDLLNGQTSGSNSLSTSAIRYVPTITSGTNTFYVPEPVYETLTLSITGATATTGSGTLTLYLV